jgi:hypothetical protein
MREEKVGGRYLELTQDGVRRRILYVVLNTG